MTLTEMVEKCDGKSPFSVKFKSVECSFTENDIFRTVSLSFTSMVNIYTHITQERIF